MLRSIYQSKKARILSVAIALTMITGAQQAFAIGTNLTMTTSQHETTSSPIYAEGFGEVTYEWFNDNSTHGVGFGVYWSPAPGVQDNK